MRKINYCEALREAIDQEMERDSSVFIYGIGVPDHKKIFGTTAGLLEKYGSDRCFDTPIAEDSMTGFALGAAIKGMRPIHVHIRVDFLLLAMNQLVNMIATHSFASLGNIPVPIVIRAVIGRGWGQGYQHSKSLFSYFTHIPGLKVIAPTTAYDAKGLLTAAIRDNSPVVFLEHRWLYWAEDEVPKDPYTIPIGQGRVLRKGKDITIVATSWMNVEAVHAARILSAHGIEVEIVDPRTLYPLDLPLIVESVQKTKYCIVADCDWVSSGYSAEIAALLSEHCFGCLKKPVKRIGFAHTHCPTARHLENAFYPSAETLVRAVEEMLGLSSIDVSSENFYSHELKFKGPF
jgi:pyruvate/2-oxoglutarate/acetoin dehydrogenase E1 component